VLSDRNQNWFIHEWLMGRQTTPEWTVLHAHTRDDPPATPYIVPKRLTATA
jgi:hypothetical protein